MGGGDVGLGKGRYLRGSVLSLGHVEFEMLIRILSRNFKQVRERETEI